jgi:hypothetical protein
VTDSRLGQASRHVRAPSRAVAAPQKGPEQTFHADKILRKLLEVSLLHLEFHLRRGRPVEQALAVEHQRVLVSQHLQPCQG